MDTQEQQTALSYKVPRKEDAIIGIASFVNVFKIGPLVKFPSIQSLLVPFFLRFLDMKAYLPVVPM